MLRSLLVAAAASAVVCAGTSRRERTLVTWLAGHVARVQESGHVEIDDAMVLRTRSVQVGARIMPLRAPSISQKSAIAIAHGDVIEHVEATREGIEQSWTFEHRPEGEGPLELHLAIASATFEGQSSEGLSFATARGRIRYGNATWVDASHARHPVLARWEPGEIVLTVPAEVMASTAYPAVLDPLVSPEIEVNAPTSFEPATNAHHPSVAFDGTNAMVLYSDDRLGIPTRNLVARVTPSGSLLDPVGIPLPIGGKATITFDGTNYVVASNGGSTGGMPPEMRLWRVSIAGKLLDATGVKLTLPSCDGHPAVVAGAKNVLVGCDNTATMIDATGKTLATFTIPIPAGTFGKISSLQLAWNGSIFLIAWSESALSTSVSAFRAMRVSSTGTMIGSPFTVHEQCDCSVASNGTDFFAAWAEKGSIRGRRIRGDGTLPDAAPIAIYVPGSPAREGSEPFVAFDSTNYVVAYEYDATSVQPSIRVSRVTASGSVLDPSGVQVDAQGLRPVGQSRPAAVGVGKSSYIVWEQREPKGLTTLHGARFTTTGTAPDISGGLVIAQTAPLQSNPRLSFDGTNYLAVWLENRDVIARGLDAPVVMAARIARSGAILDPAGVVVAGDTKRKRYAAVAFDGTNHLVAYWQEGAIVGKRISKSGTVIDATAIELTPEGGEFVSLAFGGGTYLATYARLSNIHAVRFSPAGIASPPFRVSATKDYEPTLASDGSQFYVGYIGDVGAKVVRVSAAGSVLDIPAMALGTRGGAPSIACNSAQCIASWIEAIPPPTPPGPVTSEFRAARIKSTGPAEALTLSSIANMLGPATAAWNGASFMLLFRVSEPMSWSDARLHMLEVATDGTVGPQFAVADSPAHHGLPPGPALAGDGLGGALTIYDRLDSNAPNGGARIRARFIGPGPWEDAGIGDAGSDATSSDAADTGSARDATTVDATGDASSPSDAGAVDSAAPPPPPGEEGGGGCSTAPTHRDRSSLAFAFGLAVAAAAWRSRRRSVSADAARTRRP